VQEHIGQQSNDERPHDVSAIDGARREDAPEGSVEELRQAPDELDEPCARSRVEELERKAHDEEGVKDTEEIIDDARDTRDENDTTGCVRSSCAAEGLIDEIGSHTDR